ncbi:MAG: hypothetical protein BAJALOKI1v1_40040 [Promethearchaeota archaeon]|nr:MAG: hypothetical protein BAJALOKI1v1_40040 [Candidatus Lokiarchaeota archaeon]
MPTITFKCTCGEKISYDIESKSFEEELDKLSVVPTLISHKDHFITVYVDKNYAVRSVERIVLVKDDESSLIVNPSLNEDQLHKKVEAIKERRDPSKEFFSFLSILITEIKEPESLFLAGRYIGTYLWNKKREPIIKLGATFKVDPLLVLKNEIGPIYKNLVKIENIDSEEKTIVIRESISPQFMVGIAQGILDAISNHADRNINIVLEYVMSGSTVFLSLQES